MKEREEHGAALQGLGGLEDNRDVSDPTGTYVYVEEGKGVEIHDQRRKRLGKDSREFGKRDHKVRSEKKGHRGIVAKASRNQTGGRVFGGRGLQDTGDLSSDSTPSALRSRFAGEVLPEERTADGASQTVRTNSSGQTGGVDKGYDHLTEPLSLLFLLDALDGFNSFAESKQEREPYPEGTSGIRADTQVCREVARSLGLPAWKVWDSCAGWPVKRIKAARDYCLGREGDYAETLKRWNSRFTT